MRGLRAARRPPPQTASRENRGPCRVIVGSSVVVVLAEQLIPVYQVQAGRVVVIEALMVDLVVVLHTEDLQLVMVTILLHLHQLLQIFHLLILME